MKKCSKSKTTLINVSRAALFFYTFTDKVTNRSTRFFFALLHFNIQQLVKIYSEGNIHIRLFVLQQIHLPALQGLSQATGSLHLCMLSIFNRLDDDNQTGAALCSA